MYSFVWLGGSSTSKRTNLICCLAVIHTPTKMAKVAAEYSMKVFAHRQGRELNMLEETRSTKVHVAKATQEYARRKAYSPTGASGASPQIPTRLQGPAVQVRKFLEYSSRQLPSVGIQEIFQKKRDAE